MSSGISGHQASLVTQSIEDPPANAGDVGSIPGLGRSPGEGNGNPLKYSFLGNPMDRGVWWAAVHGVAELGTTEQQALNFWVGQW